MIFALIGKKRYSHHADTVLYLFYTNLISLQGPGPNSSSMAA